MSSILNRLFQKTNGQQTTTDRLDFNQEFLRHFYSQGFSSSKLDVLKKNISTISFSSNQTQALYQLIKAYLEIEHYLTIQDAGFLGTKKSLRKEIQNVYPDVASSPAFSVLYKEDTTQEIALSLLLTNYLYECATDHCSYISTLAPEFVIERALNLDEVQGNMVYYLSCRRKIKEYIDKLSKDVSTVCREKDINNNFNKWHKEFTSFYDRLKVLNKISYYALDDASFSSPLAKPVTTAITTDSLKIDEQPKDTVQSKGDASLFTSIVENMLDKVIAFKRSGTIILANEPARIFFDLKKENLSNHNIFNLLPPEIGEELKQDIEDRTYKRQKTVLSKRIETHLSKPDGTIEYYEIATSNNYTEGDDTYSVFLKNITQKRDTLDTLSKEMEHAQRAAKAKSTFLSNMSHEIRTPLNVILGLADIIKKGDNTDHDLFQKNIEGIDFSAKNLLSIVNDILDFSKIEAGKLSIQSYDYNLRKVITSLAQGFKTKASEKGIRLFTDIDQNIPDVVVGDQYRLNQILTNLIGNAIKFTVEGQIGVIVTCKEISQDQIEVHFEVNDSGVGIPADKLDHIFDSFYQIEEAGNSKSNGTGLGLAITKELISLQNGTLTATSIEGEGSSFCFKLPLTKSKLQSTGETIKSHERNDKQLEGLRVLVAEDNTMNQFYIKQLLNRLDIEVDIAENGQEAVDMYALQQKGYYDLILMDMHMPILGGIEAIKTIRKSHKDSIKKVPIVICSADVFPESRKNAIKAGIDFYLTKPVDESAIKEVLFWLISDEDTMLETTTPKIEETRSSSVNIDKLRETFDNDEEFIISLLEIFIKDTPDDYKSLSTCVEREFYSRASSLAHKMKSSFMNLGMTHQGHFLQQIEKDINTRSGFENGKKHYEQFKKIYSRTLLDVNILLIELKRS